MNIHKDEIGAKVVDEFNAASKGRMSKLPEHVKKAYKQGRIKTKHLRKMAAAK